MVQILKGTHIKGQRDRFYLKKSYRNIEMTWQRCMRIIFPFRTEKRTDYTVRFEPSASCLSVSLESDYEPSRDFSAIQWTHLPRTKTLELLSPISH